jgi:myo-inositol-1(or 4)-monophosphatase
MSNLSKFDFYNILRPIVISGGLILNSYRGKVQNIPKKSDLPEDKVQASSTAHTIVDDLVQEVALQALHGLAPEFRINVEEDTKSKVLFEGNDSEYVFHLDPLDGTLAYLKGMDSFCIGAGVSKETEFIASAIYLPARDEFYYAEKNKGILVSNHLGEELIFERKNVPDLKYVQKRCNDKVPVLQKMGLSEYSSMSAHYSMVAVAKGDVMVQLYHLASPHDFGIPKVLVEEAGGVCTNEKGEKIAFDENLGRTPYFYAFFDEPSKREFFKFLSN